MNEDPYIVRRARPKKRGRGASSRRLIWSTARRAADFLRRRKLTLILVSLLSMAVILASQGLQQTKYVAASVVSIEIGRTLLAGNAASVRDPDAVSELMAEQLQVFREPAFADQLVRELKLADDGIWAADAHPIATSAAKALSPFLAKLGLHIEEWSPGKATHAEVVDRVSRTMRVRRKSSSLLIEVEVTAPDPTSAAEIANGAANLFLEKDIASRYDPIAPAAENLRPLEVVSVRKVAEAQVGQADAKFSQDVLALTILLGTMLGIGAAVFVDRADQGVGGFSAAAKKTGRDALASVPVLRQSELVEAGITSRHPCDYVVAKPMSAYAESLRSLRTALLYASKNEQSRNQPPQIICITSALSHEGKTTTALGLARAAALAGQKVVLIDCDLRRRALNGMLNINPDAGLLDVVIGGAPWRDVAVRDPLSSVTVIPAGESLFKPRDMFTTEAAQQLLQALRGSYDLIVLDAPSVLSVPEARTIARLADDTVLVVHWTKTPAKMVKSAIRILETSGSDVSGLVLNFVDPKAVGRLSVGDTAYQAKYATRYYSS